MKWPRLAMTLVAVTILGVLAATAERSSAAMASAAARFLASLSIDQRQRTSFAFDATERTNWHYIPRERKGLPIKAMNPEQRNLARELLRTGLSQRGYLTASAIMDLETILGDLERRTGAGSIVRDPELYFFSVFGAPGVRDTWGWRIEGHHLSLNFTVVGGTRVASTPWFFGTNPAEVRDGPQKGLRILGQEEDAARALLQALDPDQRRKAIIEGAAPKEIVTANAVKIDSLSPAGISAGALNASERELLMRLVEVYTSAMAADIAADRTARLEKAGAERISFAWAGDIERGKPHYYRIQGPTFLVEYDNTQNDANHIHSVWRDFDGDFGRDLLREHLKSSPH